MASKNTITMIEALADDCRLRMFEALADCDRSDRKLSEMLDVDIEAVKENIQILERSGLVIACDEGDCINCSLDPQQVAILTGFFELMLNKCSPPKCC